MTQLPTNPLATAEPWNRVVEGYTAVTMRALAAFAEPAIDKAGLCPEWRVLDVAAGPGTVACRVAPRVKEVQAVDFSSEMVAKCRARATSLGLENVVASVADGQALPFENDRFDVAFSMFGVIFFPNRLTGFREMQRALRPGGRVFATSWASVSQSSLMTVFLAALRAAEPNLPAPQTNLASLENRDLFAAELAEAGFVDVDIEPVFRDQEYRSAAELLDSHVRGSAPMEVMRHRLSETEWNRRLDVMRAYLESAITSWPTRLGSTAWLGTGRKPA